MNQNMHTSSHLYRTSRIMIDITFVTIACLHLNDSFYDQKQIYTNIQGNMLLMRQICSEFNMSVCA